MKLKVAIDLPDVRDVGRGLAPRDLHPALARAELAAVAAEAALERSSRSLADAERAVAAIPDRVHAGELQPGALIHSLRERDARALLIGPAERALTKARERVIVEEKAAAAAVHREILRRCEVLERTAAELAPILERLNQLSRALAVALSPAAIGGISNVDWPCGLGCGAARRAAMLPPWGGV